MTRSFDDLTLSYLGNETKYVIMTKLKKFDLLQFIYNYMTRFCSLNLDRKTDRQRQRLTGKQRLTDKDKDWQTDKDWLTDKQRRQTKTDRQTKNG